MYYLTLLFITLSSLLLQASTTSLPTKTTPSTTITTTNSTIYGVITKAGHDHDAEVVIVGSSGVFTPLAQLTGMPTQDYGLSAFDMKNQILYFSLYQNTIYVFDVQAKKSLPSITTGKDTRVLYMTWDQKTESGYLLIGDASTDYHAMSFCSFNSSGVQILTSVGDVKTTLMGAGLDSDNGIFYFVYSTFADDYVGTIRLDDVTHINSTVVLCRGCEIQFMVFNPNSGNLTGFTFFTASNYYWVFQLNPVTMTWWSQMTSIMSFANSVAWNPDTQHFFFSLEYGGATDYSYYDYDLTSGKYDMYSAKDPLAVLQSSVC